MTNNIEPIIKALCKKITKRTGMDDDYNLEITKGMDDEYTVAIQKGNPPTVYLNYYVIIYSLGEENKLKFLKDRLTRALDLVPRMTWTLSNNPPAPAIGLKGAGVTRWIKANSFDAFVHVISDKFFKVTFSVDVEVIDRFTGISVKLSGSDPYKLEQDAKKRLAQMVLESEQKADLEEFLEMTSPKIVPEEKPDMIIISEGKREIIEEFKYE